MNNQLVNGTLSYEGKYINSEEHGNSKARGMASAKRLIPAPLEPDLAAAIQATALDVFKAIDASGVIRIDFFVRPSEKTFYVNEINPIPVSLFRSTSGKPLA